ncbi:MAG: response regulator [Gammaproteobacteria bacterium]|nr:response regulator [Gammaproteobacteria bacterium]
MAEKKQKIKILFVDDERQILIPLKAMFKKQYGVRTAISGPAGLEIVRNDNIQIVVSDQRMPEMQGIEFLRVVKEISPNTVRILLTGYADLSAVMESVNTGEIFRFIEKPWNNERLRSIIETAADLSSKQAGQDLATPQAVRKLAVQRMGVLLVDEDIELCGRIHRLFGSEHNIYCAHNVHEALLVLGKQEDIAVLLTDTVVHGEETAYLIHRLKQTYPLIVSVILTKQTDAHQIVRLINQGQIFRFLPKPVETDALKYGIEAALKRHAQLKHIPVSTLMASQSVEAPAPEEVPKTEVASSIGDKLKSLKTRMARFLRLG